MNLGQPRQLLYQRVGEAAQAFFGTNLSHLLDRSRAVRHSSPGCLTESEAKKKKKTIRATAIPIANPERAMERAHVRPRLMVETVGHYFPSKPHRAKENLLLLPA